MKRIAWWARGGGAGPSALPPRPGGEQIGVVGPLTGQFAAVGQSQLYGAEMKAKELNAKGGKFKVEIISEDDASNCDQSVNATVKLVTRDRVAAVLGAANSPCALAMVPVTKRYQTPHFTSAWHRHHQQAANGSPGAVAAMGRPRPCRYAVKKLNHRSWRCSTPTTSTAPHGRGVQGA